MGDAQKGKLQKKQEDGGGVRRFAYRRNIRGSSMTTDET